MHTWCQPCITWRGNVDHRKLLISSYKKHCSSHSNTSLAIAARSYTILIGSTWKGGFAWRGFSAWCSSRIFNGSRRRPRGRCDFDAAILEQSASRLSAVLPCLPLLPPGRAGCFYYHNRAATHRPCALVCPCRHRTKNSWVGHWRELRSCRMLQLADVVGGSSSSRWYTTAAAAAAIAYRVVFPTRKLAWKRSQLASGCMHRCKWKNHACV